MRIHQNVVLLGCFTILASLLLRPAAGQQVELPAVQPAYQGQPPEPPLARDIERPPLPDEIILRDYKIIAPVGAYGRAAFHRDAVEALLASGQWKPPRPKQTLTDPDGVIHPWRLALADRDGRLEDADLRGGYAYVEVEAPRAGIMMLEAQGHGSVFVNGHPRAGDPYNHGWLSLPIALRRGKNELLFHVGAGVLQAKLTKPARSLMLDLADITVPHVLSGESAPLWGAIVVKNASAELQTGLRLEVTVEGQAQTWRSEPFLLPPLTVRKVPFQIRGENLGAAARQSVQVRLIAAEKKPAGEPSAEWDAVRFPLKRRDPSGLHRRTFVSGIDASVQHYAVLPAARAVSTGQRPAAGEKQREPGAILSLHGAGVSAEKQAQQYEPKSWAHIIAPTNRRSYGFDWEDWGRIDALEALADAREHLPIDPQRLYLSGHSMGGHGAWHIAATLPDRFAAIGPAAGWISFWSYGATRVSESATAMEKLLARASGSSDTLKMSLNYRGLGVYVLHGAEDENVPVTQSRRMRAQLGGFHDNFAYFEKRGGAHWWGPETLDWTPMMEDFRRQKRRDPADVDRIELVTHCPGITSRSHWVSIGGQQELNELSKVEIEQNTSERHFIGTTDNVARLEIDVSHLPPEEALHVTLDGQKFGPLGWPSASRKVWFRRDDDRWSLATRPKPTEKRPARYGLFKDVFNNRVLFVYGTQGNPEENQWALAKARFDAETFWYRGNGSIEVIPDAAFELGKYRDRNVVLYGNIETNAAWPALLSTCPVQVYGNRVEVGTRPEMGDDLGCLFIYPRSDSTTASVGVVSGTGLAGMRATSRLRYFISGIAYPDLVIFGTGALEQGVQEVRMLGYFGLDWSLEKGAFEWRDLAL